MKIGILGWYNRQNIGDERIFQCLQSFFSMHEIRSFNLIEAPHMINQINSCDYVLLGGGGLLLRRFNRFYDLFNKIHRPIGLVGIGVEAMAYDMKRTVDLLLEKSDYILVRDQESKELLGNHRKVIVGPDLTFLSNHDLVHPVEEKVVGLNLRNWHAFKTEYGSPSWSLLGIIEKWFKPILPFKKWDEKRLIDLLRNYKGEIFPMPFDFSDDVNILKQHFETVSSTFDIDWYKKIRYLVSMRLHPIIFSVQCGIPFISLSYQPKCTRFCRSIGMDHYCLDIYADYDQIICRLNDLENDYEAIRRNLILQRQKLTSDIHNIMSKILSIMMEQVS